MTTISPANLLEPLHEGMVKGRRARRLISLISEILPQDVQTMLDVGAGDGAVAAGVREFRPGLDVSGVDVLVRADTRIPVQEYDGKKLPFHDNAFDCVLLTDVLHHTPDPQAVLAECARVSRRYVIVKDHYARNFFEHRLLRLMDLVGNIRFGVDVPSNYLHPEEWRVIFSRCGLIEEHVVSKLALYPAWADWLFGANLHFLARLKKESV